MPWNVFVFYEGYWFLNNSIFFLLRKWRDNIFFYCAIQNIFNKTESVSIIKNRKKIWESACRIYSLSRILYPLNNVAKKIIDFASFTDRWQKKHFVSMWKREKGNNFLWLIALNKHIDWKLWQSIPCYLYHIVFILYCLLIFDERVKKKSLYRVLFQMQCW